MSRVLDIACRPLRRLAEHRRFQQPLTMARLRAYAANIDKAGQENIKEVIRCVEQAVQDNMTSDKILKCLDLRCGDLPKLCDSMIFFEQKVDGLWNRRVAKGNGHRMTVS